MAIPPLNLYSLNGGKRSLAVFNPETPCIATRTDSQFKFQFPLNSSCRIRYRGFKFPCKALGSVLPGGSWWRLCDSKEEGGAGNPVTVRDALLRMWELLGNDQWIMYVAFASLITAAVSEITMPSILAASVFSAQNGEAMAFSRNAHLLAMLCLTSGISSGLRSGCFAIANMILVNRLRETLYSALIFQDITFFDTEEVGGLTSRLGSDCQRLSHGTGALINLLCLSGPLALSSLVICSVLAIVFRIFARYQKIAAKLTQDATACANEVLAVLLGGMSITTGRVSTEQLTKYILYCEWLIYATWRVVDNSLSLLQAIGASEKVFQLIQRSPSNQFLSNGMKLQRLMGQIHFVDVSFHYPSRPKVPILEHLHLSIEANEVVALVGLSGSGKTTLVNLLLRLYEPINGQEPELFHADVKSNITYGCHRDIKQEDIECAAKLAHAHQFILSLPDGYGTLIDDDLLSGGQKQRIAIARAILRNPVILIFDEATSALDPESEHYFKEMASHLASGPHIADVNILLPPKMTHLVEYRLQGSDGCFKWSWDHHDILSVLPEYNLTSHCSTSARLRSIAPFSGRKETAVYAAEVHSGIVIRCKVFIDNISRIQIFHNSIKLDLDGLATLRVRAFDSEDNVFSSLVGLQFMWQLIPEAVGLPHHLVHVPLKESPLSDCGGLCGDLNIQIKLEDSGVFSDLYVVKGIGIGHENVYVHLLEPQFKHVADKIVLTVAEAMSLEPLSPVFVLIGAAFLYSLKVIRGNIPQVVTLPSPHHRWFVSNSTIAEVDSMMGFVHAMNLGVTTVVVEDTRIAGHIQMSSLNVVLPDSLRLYIMPLSISGDHVEGVKAIPSMEPWYVVSGRQYLIQMKVFSRGPDVHEIYITETDDLKLHDERSNYWTTFLPSEDIEAKYGWHNSRILRATSQGQGELTASLSYFSGHQETKEVIGVVQEVIVCDQVKFILDRTTGASQNILLPWAPSVYQETELKALGGCAQVSSDYKWLSSDVAVVSISASGIVQAKKPGKATVRVVSIYEPFNYDELIVEVSIPSSMIILQKFPVETLVGSHLQAAVTMKASNGAFFYSCNAFHSFIKWITGSESFVVVNATKEPPVLAKLGNVELHDSVYGPPCSWTSVYALDSGQTMLHAVLSKEYDHYDHSFHEPIILKASSRIAAYPPLIVRQVGDGNQFGGYWFDLAHVEASNQLENLERLYLVPGTSLDVILLGGPESWDKGVDFIETVEILDDKHTDSKDGVHVHPVFGRYQSMYRVSCQNLGIFKLVFKRGNAAGDDHPLPAIAEDILTLTCRIPSSIALIVDEPLNRHEAIRNAALADRSKGKIQVNSITVANGRTIRIAAVSIDSSGETFANSSSLALKWELSSCEGLAYWDADEAKLSKSSWERFLVLQNESGECIVRAAVIGFCDAIVGHYSAQLPTSEIVLTDAMRLRLVSTLRVNPEFNLLFFNPNAKVDCDIILMLSILFSSHT
ncbi:hypothetical protein GH714_009821 [Hevea brasiliensis]|uniref:Uncharacterized protein n=1 Tax=Hevea brasiliensis TaxID=3981 RepID=A0A6A6M7C2_HEVBR|nr:hypothetical protein GH714_009821 [Hevea brasiliensis]